ncbi:MAG TPA: PmoA family protein [Chloroflexota bacterium]|jgi:hypothetical protein|nr:PmoA family protein [Chloroflexota bacterium]
MSTGLRVVHTLQDRVDVSAGEHPLFTYIYVPQTAQRESPQPYFHPLQTLGGETISIYRPHDHLWHKGLAMTSAHLSGENFWGGPTYERDRGYVHLENNGRMLHLSWDELHCEPDAVGMTERLAWITRAGETWIAEDRRMSVSEVQPAQGFWSLDLTFTLRNVRGAALTFGSPTTAGRPGAGYGGLFWRGPRSFLRGAILAGGGLSGPEVMGQAAPWLAYIGRHDGSGRTSTIVFLDQPGNPRYPTKWFVRNDPYACASCAFTFDEELTLAPEETLSLQYRVVIADGAWTAERVEEYRKEPA